MREEERRELRLQEFYVRATGGRDEVCFVASLNKLTYVLPLMYTGHKAQDSPATYKNMEVMSPRNESLKLMFV